MVYYLGDVITVSTVSLVCVVRRSIRADRLAQSRAPSCERVKSSWSAINQIKVLVHENIHYDGPVAKWGHPWRSIVSKTIRGASPGNNECQLTHSMS